MIWRAWRLTFAMQRLELGLILGATVLLVITSVVIAWQIGETKGRFQSPWLSHRPGSRRVEPIDSGQCAGFVGR